VDRCGPLRVRLILRRLLFGVAVGGPFGKLRFPKPLLLEHAAQGLLRSLQMRGVTRGSFAQKARAGE
jgi:hypothetical protein